MILLDLCFRLLYESNKSLVIARQEVNIKKIRLMKVHTKYSELLIFEWMNECTLNE